MLSVLSDKHKQRKHLSVLGRGFIGALSALLLLCSVSHAKSELDIDWTIAENPRIKEAIFSLHQGNYFEGINLLISLRSFSDLNEEADLSELLLGTLYLAYGMPNEATEIFLDLLDRGTNTITQEQLWFHVAKIQYQRGNYDKAEKSLSHIKNRFTKELGEQQTFLEALLLMRRSQYKLAVEKLKTVKSNSEWSLYSLYNLAVSFAKIGRKEESTATFEIISKLKGKNTKEMQALQDKSNLALGYIYLNDNDPNRARQYMQNVQLNGPLTNKALLGLGWSYSAMNQHKKSLVAWMELTDREKTDASVLESYLSIPYAYGKLEAFGQAINGYEKAITMYKASTGEIDKLIGRINDGDLLKPLLDIDSEKKVATGDLVMSLSDKVDRQYLMFILASHEFQEAYKSYREVKELSEKLLLWESTIDKFRGISTTFRDAYMDRILRQQAQTDQILDELEEYIKTITINSLTYQKNRIESFIAKARFSMAQIYDKSTRDNFNEPQATEEETGGDVKLQPEAESPAKPPKDAAKKPGNAL